MAGHGEKASRKQDQAIAALLSEPTVAAAAAKARVGERTLRRWLTTDAEFLRAYRVARRAVVEQAVAELQRVASAAATTLALALRAENDGDRIRAACSILDRATKGVELIDLAERVAELERRLANDGRPGAAA